MRKGDNHVVAGLVAAVALPLGVFLIGLPLIVAVPAAVVLYVGVALALAPRPRTALLDAGRVDRAQAAIAEELITEGEASAAKLRAAAARLTTPANRTSVERLGDAAQKILGRLAAEPEKLPAVRRFLTYYLPRSVEVAQGLGTLERQLAPDASRRADIEAILTRLGQAFDFYADNLDASDLAALHVELKLVDRALAEDLGQPPRTSVPAARRS